MIHSVLALEASERQYMNLAILVLDKFTMEIETEMFLLVVSSQPTFTPFLLLLVGKPTHS